jgi:hypothetical protein
MHSPSIEELEEFNKIFKKRECYLSIKLNNDTEVAYRLEAEENTII